MNKHSVFVAGKHFVLLSDDKDEYVQNLAKEVGDTINSISLQNPTLDRRSAAILCALDYADDKYKEIERAKRLTEKAQPLIAQADRQSKKLRELQKKLEEQQEIIERLTTAKKNLEEVLAAKMREAEHKGSEKNAEPVNVLADSGKNKKGYTPTRQISLFDDEKH